MTDIYTAGYLKFIQTHRYNQSVSKEYEHKRKWTVDASGRFKGKYRKQWNMSLKLRRFFFSLSNSNTTFLCHYKNDTYC